MDDGVAAVVKHRVAVVVQHRVPERIDDRSAGEEVEHGLAADVRHRRAGERVDHKLAAAVGELLGPDVVRVGVLAVLRALEHDDAVGVEVLERDVDLVERAGDVARVARVDDLQDVTRRGRGLHRVEDALQGD